MSSPKISIVIPSFNKVRYIEETLRSIVDQDYKNLEVIIQDGGSTDGTLEIIKKFAKNYPELIKWESKKDKGQLDAIKTGLRKATGEIVTYINADDVYTKGTFGEIAKAYTNSPNALWFAGKGIVIDANSHEIAKPVTLYKSFCLRLNIYFLLLTFNFLMQPSVFITKEAYKKYGPFTGTKDFVMEYDLWLKLGKIQMPVPISKALTKFRIEQGTKTKIGFKKLLAEDWKIVKSYTQNPITLILHYLHNQGRILIERFT